MDMGMDMDMDMSMDMGIGDRGQDMRYRGKWAARGGLGQ
jgi:hypothetical protein